MAAHEEEHERVVVMLGVRDEDWRRARLDRIRAGDEPFTPPARRFAADDVGHSADGDLDQPTAWIGGHTFARPLGRRGEQRFLDRVLGGMKIAKPAHHGAEHLRRQLTQQALGRLVETHQVRVRREARS